VKRRLAGAAFVGHLSCAGSYNGVVSPSLVLKVILEYLLNSVYSLLSSINIFGK